MRDSQLRNLHYLLGEYSKLLAKEGDLKIAANKLLNHLDKELS